VRVESGLGQCADADTVCFIFIAACEIDLLLCRSTLSYGHTGLNGVGISTCCAKNQGAQH